MSSDEPGFTNRLIGEKSPYLLQHAHNPVDWYPWGDEAFARARREDLPVFLSIGYSTCHWCHVMERESFEDPEVAELLNAGFVPIKVDREERPDIDDQYMTVCQLLTGQGGWPLTLVLAPDKRPFFAGTYFPKLGRFGRPGMVELLPGLTEAWRTRRQEVLATARRVTEALQRPVGRASGTAPSPVPAPSLIPMPPSDSPGAPDPARASAPGGTSDPVELGESALERAANALERGFDSRNGGFGTAPKFPTPHTLVFLLRYAERTGEPRAREMVQRTLHAMRRGGIFDQLGFGFHRYSTDANWLVPHFEKMLYDQALLTLAYTEAFQAIGAAEFGATAREICAYVLRDLTDARGGFYCAEDADSEGEEGRFYLWAEEDIRAAAGERGLELARSAFGVRPEGNYVDELLGRRTGSNILHRPKGAAHPEMRDDGGGAPGASPALEELRTVLLEARNRRVRPGLDDKILTGWNGLMIAALARAGAALGEEDFTAAAIRAADFLLRELEPVGRGLLRRHRDGESAIPALAPDYAFLTWGLLELYEASFDPRWLDEARRLTRALLESFWDAGNGGFYLTPDGAEDLLVRRKDSYDGAVPSANSVAAMNLLRLARLTGDVGFEERAAGVLRWARDLVEAAPTGHTHLLCALDLALGPVREIVVVGDREEEDACALLESVRGAYLHGSAVLLVRSGPEGEALRALVPYVAEMRRIDGRATAYVCSNFTCQNPTTDPAELGRQLATPGRPSNPPV